MAPGGALHLKGPRVLEVSLGTGYLMTEYANRFEVHGLDLNAKLNAIGRANLQRAGVRAILCRGTVEALPYRIDSFDCVRMEDDSLGFASPAFDGGR